MHVFRAQNRTKQWKDSEQGLAQPKKVHLKTQNCSANGQAVSIGHGPHYIPPAGHCTKSFKCIIITYTFKYINYIITLQSPQQLPVRCSRSNTGTLFLNISTPLLVLLLFCCFSQKSQLSSPSSASFWFLPLPSQPHTLSSP